MDVSQLFLQNGTTRSLSADSALPLPSYDTSADGSSLATFMTSGLDLQAGLSVWVVWAVLGHCSAAGSQAAEGMVCATEGPVWVRALPGIEVRHTRQGEISSLEITEPLGQQHCWQCRAQPGHHSS